MDSKQLNGVFFAMALFVIIMIGAIFVASLSESTATAQQSNETVSDKPAVDANVMLIFKHNFQKLPIVYVSHPRVKVAVERTVKDGVLTVNKTKTVAVDSRCRYPMVQRKVVKVFYRPWFVHQDLDVKVLVKP